MTKNGGEMGNQRVPFSAISLEPFEVDFRAHQYVSKVEERNEKREQEKEKR